MEEWRDCPDAPGYQVSSLGNVKGQCGYNLKPFLTGSPKRYPTFRAGHAGKCFVVHRQIAKAFLPNPDNLPEVDHINKNPQDNRLENLRWISRSDNQLNKKLAENNTTGVKGLYYVKRKDRWTCVVQRDKVRYCSPYFKERQDAEEWLKIALNP